MENSLQENRNDSSPAAISPGWGQREKDHEKGRRCAASIRDRGFLMLAREVLEGRHQEPDREGKIDDDVGQDQARQGVVEPDLAEQQVPGANQRYRRDHVEDKRPAQEESAEQLRPPPP